MFTLYSGKWKSSIITLKNIFLILIPQEDVLLFIELVFPVASKYLQQYDEVNYWEAEESSLQLRGLGKLKASQVSNLIFRLESL